MTDTRAQARANTAPGKFVTGSLRRHILVMTGTGAVGLMAIFIGDFANILFLSLLDDTALIAAIGYASTLIFVTISVGIGMAIGATALISPELGRGRRAIARRYVVHAHILSASVAGLIALALFPFVPAILSLLGADGRTLALATDYVCILLPAMPALATGMTAAAVLRSVGDARRAMYVTLTGAVVNVILDPILIFGFGLGIHGAGIASFCARFAVMGMGLYGVIRVHKLMGRVRPGQFLADARALAAVAGPAVTTNLATPVANAYVTSAMAAFGDPAVAAWAIIGRLQPVAFGAIFALSGTIGPIIGQNFGANDADRMRAAYVEALRVTAAFTAMAWLGLAVAAPHLVVLFRAEGETAELILLFCQWLAPLFFFLGVIFVTNAVFNTLGRPKTATLINWARATLGTVPFVTVGGWLAGADGALTGALLGGVLVGAGAGWYGLRFIESFGDGAAPGRGVMRHRKIAVSGG